jgi:coenzyme F420-0:L-glutamate ligase/coenzyme F420-1:gamma-L-glutamate ligase
VSRLTLTALEGIPLVEPGDDLAAHLLEAVAASGEVLRATDVLVVAQKVVSKAEDRYVDLADVTVSDRARALAREVDKDPRLVELILAEAEEVVRYREGVLVVAHRCGFVLANAGIDQSNIQHPEGGERVLLLPQNADDSARRLRAAIVERSGCEVGVVINDSLGRAWRNGTVGVALGASGVVCLEDLRGETDLFGRELRVTDVGVADELAAAASLLMGQASAAVPAVLARGLDLRRSGMERARDLVRPKSMDLFR